MKTLQQKIMRRVYYVFALKIVTHPIFFHSFLLGLSIFALSRLVSIPNVLLNLMNVKVGEVAQFFLGALLNTQAVTILWLAIITLTSCSLLWRLIRGHNGHSFNFDRKTEWA